MKQSVLLGMLAAAVLTAHDVPADVRLQIFLKPQAGVMHIVMRAPLNALRDVEFPLIDQTFLDLRDPPKADQALRNAAIISLARRVRLYENGRPLQVPHITAVRASLESEKAFDSYEHALNHIEGAKLPPETRVPWNQVMLDVAMEAPVADERSEFSIHPAFATLGLRVVTGLRLLTGNTIRAFEFENDPGLVHLDPRWHQAAWRFVQMGFLHILSGTDHLLFLAALVIPFRKLRPLLWIITAFTLAHSLTLAASALGLAPTALWFPPLIETLIAASIVYMALENIAATQSASRRFAAAFGFGLVHGFGFSFALRESMQFAGSHLALSLAAFNVGVELGQLLVLAILVPALALFLRYAVAERMGIILLSALVAHTGWHWMLDRAADLAKFSATLQTADAVRLALYAAIAIALTWIANLLWQNFPVNRWSKID
jgi:hypothetical protein